MSPEVDCTLYIIYHCATNGNGDKLQKPMMYTCDSLLGELTFSHIQILQAVVSFKLNKDFTLPDQGLFGIRHGGLALRIIV
jgi:hypothetical protein